MATQAETIKTQTEMIQALRDEVATLKAHMDVQRRETSLLQPLIQESAALKAQVANLTNEVALLRKTAEEVPVLKHQIADVAKAKDTWGNRVWLIATIALSAFFATLTAILGTLLTFTLNAKK